MHFIMCKSKILRARVTDVNNNYEGSLTIDRDLMNASDFVAFEKEAKLVLYTYIKCN